MSGFLLIHRINGEVWISANNSALLFVSGRAVVDTFKATNPFFLVMNVVIVLLQDPDKQSNNETCCVENGLSLAQQRYCMRVEQLLTQVGDQSRVQINYTEAERPFLRRSWMTSRNTFISQRSVRMEQRFKSAVAFALLSGADKLIAVRENSEWDQAGNLEDVWALLDTEEVVAGKVERDCYCIGVRNTQSGLLLGVNWESADCFDGLCRKARQLGTDVHWLKAAISQKEPESPVLLVP